jgi:hypothetical protein
VPRGSPASKNKKPPKFRSGFEKKVADNLKALKIPYEYEKEKIGYTVPSTNRNYICDFKIGDIYIEAKGVFDRETRAKMAFVIEQNPDKDIRLLFMRDNKIAKNSKTKYTDWCRKRGIKAAVSPIGEIPEEWILDATRK